MFLPLDHVRRRQTRGDDGELAFVAAQPRGFIHQSEADAFWRGLIHKKFARVWQRIGIVGDDLDTFGLGLAQRSGNTLAIFTSDGNRVHAERDPILDDLVLLRGIGIGRAVKNQIHAEFLGRFVRALLARDEVSVALGLGHECNADFLAAIRVG